MDYGRLLWKRIGIYKALVNALITPLEACQEAFSTVEGMGENSGEFTPPQGTPSGMP